MVMLGLPSAARRGTARRIRRSRPRYGTTGLGRAREPVALENSVHL